MTTIAPATSTTPAVAAPLTAPSTSRTQLAGNFDTFLKLLTTQLRNQDPSSPMDSNQFTQQLVQFSQVEQQINMNDNLKTLIGQGGSQTGAYAVSYLGKAVTVTNGKAPLADGAAAWNYNLGTQAVQTALTVTDVNGKVVFTGPGETSAGAHEFSWDGKDASGTQMPDGVYMLHAGAKAADGSTVTTKISSAGIVSAVDMTSGTPLLLVGPMAVALSDVAGVANL